MPRKLRGKTFPDLVDAAREQRHPLTNAECVLWEVLRNRGLRGLKFRRQHAIGYYILDFFCLEQSLAIEVDGDVHDNDEQRAYDDERTRRLNEAGISVLRFENREVIGHLDDVLGRIVAYIEKENKHNQGM